MTSNTTTTGQVGGLLEADVNQGLMDEGTYRLIVLVCFVITVIISPLGIIFNIINIVVFCKLGFKESTNIILVSLAVTDIFILLTVIGTAFSSDVIFPSLAQSLDILDAVAYIVLGWPNVVTTRVTGCLTTFLALERFLCVVLPLRVKVIMQKNISVRFTIALCLFSVAYSVPMYLANSIGLRFNPMSNQTSVGLIVAENSDVLEGVSISVDVFIEITSFILVTAFTVGLISSYFRTTKWRYQATGAAKDGQMTNRDRKLVKMVILVSIVFIGCSLPTVTADVAMVMVKDFNVKGRERYLFLAACAIFYNIISLNSVVNMFIYLNMSSRFRKTFLVIFSFLNETQEH
ncbi:thyrotropin-releasing hormone receptor-like [Physella acuta]|uniref:thyrotropin-releasing hormone receptor-like n=1 Tax=Physella acuta TaxID=109671 RepID=UPI0027DB2A58|nr:thyrotropin-releasing hormone receptor-like [Physella acuta]